jgi:hypothetical protein
MGDERVSWIMHNSYIHAIGNWMRNTLYNAYYTIVEISSNQSVQSYIKNGYYIPAIHAALYYVTGDAVISTTVAMKLYPANYFYWFGEYYDFRIPKKYNWIKQFVRFTDTGYLASYIYIVYPEFFPITYNIQYTLTLGFWIGKLIFKMDIYLNPIPGLNKNFETAWSNVNHGIHLALLTYRMLTDDVCHDHFTIQDLTWTYYWMYTWFFVIYMPWRLITGDCVYGVFSSDTPWSKKIIFVCLMHGIIALGNATGYLLR